MGADKSDGIKIVSENRKARFNYHIIETFEAGIVLSGPEIKSVRLSEVSIAESYVRFEKNELLWIAAHIKPYKYNRDPQYDPLRKRKLLLKKSELSKLFVRVSQRGLTLVPLKIYLKRGFAKLEIALAKGKTAPDKRESIKEREAKREIARVMSKGRR